MVIMNLLPHKDPELYPDVRSILRRSLVFWLLFLLLFIFISPWLLVFPGDTYATAMCHIGTKISFNDNRLKDRAGLQKKLYNLYRDKGWSIDAGEHVLQLMMISRTYGKDTPCPQGACLSSASQSVMGAQKISISPGSLLNQFITPSVLHVTICGRDHVDVDQLVARSWDDMWGITQKKSYTLSLDEHGCGDLVAPLGDKDLVSTELFLQDNGKPWAIDNVRFDFSCRSNFDLLDILSWFNPNEYR